MVKRYDLSREYIGDGEYIGAMEEDSNGDFIRYEDHKQIVDELKDQIEDLKIQVEVEMFRE